MKRGRRRRKREEDGEENEEEDEKEEGMTLYLQTSICLNRINNYL